MKHYTRRVRCIEDDIVYESLTEAARVYGCSVSLIWGVCNGLREVTKGCHFEYV